MSQTDGDMGNVGEVAVLEDEAGPDRAQVVALETGE